MRHATIKVMGGLTIKELLLGTIAWLRHERIKAKIMGMIKKGLMGALLKNSVFYKMIKP